MILFAVWLVKRGWIGPSSVNARHSRVHSSANQSSFPFHISSAARAATRMPLDRRTHARAGSRTACAPTLTPTGAPPMPVSAPPGRCASDSCQPCKHTASLTRACFHHPAPRARAVASPASTSPPSRLYGERGEEERGERERERWRFVSLRKYGCIRSKKRSELVKDND